MEETEPKSTVGPPFTSHKHPEDIGETLLEHPLHSELELEHTEKEESEDEVNVPPEEEHGRGLRRKKPTQRGMEYEMQRKEKMLNTAIRKSEKQIQYLKDLLHDYKEETSRTRTFRVPSLN